MGGVAPRAQAPDLRDCRSYRAKPRRGGVAHRCCAEPGAAELEPYEQSSFCLPARDSKIGERRCALDSSTLIVAVAPALWKSSQPTVRRLVVALPRGFDEGHYADSFGAFALSDHECRQSSSGVRVHGKWADPGRTPRFSTATIVLRRKLVSWATSRVLGAKKRIQVRRMYESGRIAVSTVPPRASMPRTCPCQCRRIRDWSGLGELTTPGRRTRKNFRSRKFELRARAIAVSIRRERPRAGDLLEEFHDRRFARQALHGLLDGLGPEW